MADRNQLLNNQEMAMRAALTGWQAGLWTSMPAIVQSVDLTKMTLVAQIAIQGTTTDINGNPTQINISQLVDVPICFPNAGGFILTFPISQGDEVLVVIASRCIDSWWQSGGYQNVPLEPRMHDLSDGFAIPGPRSIPRLVEGISSTAVQLRNIAGNVYLGLTPAGLIQAVNPTITLGGLLQNMMGDLTTLNAALIAYSGTIATPVTTVAQIVAATATLATALGSVTAGIATTITKIEGLLT